MKKVTILLALLTVGLFSCKKEDVKPNTEPTPTANIGAILKVVDQPTDGSMCYRSIYYTNINHDTITEYPTVETDGTNYWFVVDSIDWNYAIYVSADNGYPSSGGAGTLLYDATWTVYKGNTLLYTSYGYDLTFNY